MLDKFFKLSEKGTTVKTEILAGVTTFLAMAYILAVNPAMLGETGMSVQGVFLATAIASAGKRLWDLLQTIQWLYLLVWV